MTEVRKFYDGTTPEIDLPHSPRIISAIKYSPNPELLDAITETLNEEGQRILGKKVIALHTRVLRFNSLPQTQEFTGNIVASKLERQNSELARVNLLPESAVDTIHSPLGDAFQFRLKSFGRQAMILGNIYDEYLRYMNNGDMGVVLSQSEEERALSSQLSFSVPARLTDFDADDTLDKLNKSLHRRYNKGKLLYANEARLVHDTDRR